ncbi:MAG: hypothetical protein GXY06_00965 [Clostridiaceae bacterium]|nr:hypothetical protein [Clostridiaceae bacterium]
MSSLDLITNKIISDANASAASRIERANEEARLIFERKAAAATLECERLRAEADINLERLRFKSESAAKALSGKRMLTEKGRLIDDCILKAREIIVNMSTEEAFHMISKFVGQSLIGVHQPATLILSENDLKRMPSNFIEKLASDIGTAIMLSDQPGNFDAGCIVKCELVEYNGTPDALIREHLDQLSDTIGAILFSDESKSKLTTT